MAEARHSAPEGQGRQNHKEQDHAVGPQVFFRAMGQKEPAKSQRAADQCKGKPHTGRQNGPQLAQIHQMPGQAEGQLIFHGVGTVAVHRLDQQRGKQHPHKLKGGKITRQFGQRCLAHDAQQEKQKGQHRQDPRQCPERTAAGDLPQLRFDIVEHGWSPSFYRISFFWNSTTPATANTANQRRPLTQQRPI